MRRGAKPLLFLETLQRQPNKRYDTANRCAAKSKSDDKAFNFLSHKPSVENQSVTPLHNKTTPTSASQIFDANKLTRHNIDTPD